MVKVVGKGVEELARIEREKRLHEKGSKLSKIAKEVCGNNFSVISFLNSIHLNYNKERIEDEFGRITDLYYDLEVSVESNLIKVRKKEYLDDAIKLAEAYEADGESEFTVKKEYNE